MTSLLPAERIERRILLIRGRKVMLDIDLAGLYGVSTKRLNEQVRRNSRRFPPDFMFQLTWEEARSSRSQIATLKQGRNVKYRPRAFTEQGVAMLSGVLHSERGIQVNVEIMRAFVRLREMLGARRGWGRRLDELEVRVGSHDQHIRAIFTAIRRLVAPARRKRRAIGFVGGGV